MPFHAASPGSVARFLGIVFAILAALFGAVRFAYRADPPAARRASGWTAAVLLLWLGTLAALIASGRMAALPLVGLPLFFGSVVVAGFGAGLSPFGGRLAAAIPLPALVGFQAFRLPLEFVLHDWAQQGSIPATMTWTGQNWDIVSGTVALLATPLAARHRAAAWIANATGAILLANVMRVALLSSPVPFGWGVTPPLVLALHLPYALIGPVCVGGALLGHIVLTRALLAPGNAGAGGR